MKRYGWKPDLPDFRDFPLMIRKPIPLPLAVDLRESPAMPAVFDQGDLGSCTANAIGSMFQYVAQKENLLPFFTPSRLFIYYNERFLEKNIESDNGAQIRTGLKVVGKFGVPSEASWPYIPQAFAARPPARVFSLAVKHKALQYHRVIPNLHILSMILAKGFPFVFGMTVYDSFEGDEVAEAGRLDTPGDNESPLGGHAVMAVGYDAERGRFIVRNSWGADWGDKGYFTMPFDYVLNNNLCDDFWAIQLVS